MGHLLLLSIVELSEASGDPSQDAIRRAYLALAKLRESHREEYDFYVERDTGQSIPLPTHGSRDVRVGLKRNVVRILKISREEWNSL